MSLQRNIRRRRHRWLFRQLLLLCFFFQSLLPFSVLSYCCCYSLNTSCHHHHHPTTSFQTMLQSLLFADVVIACNRHLFSNCCAFSRGEFVVRNFKLFSLLAFFRVILSWPLFLSDCIFDFSWGNQTSLCLYM